MSTPLTVNGITFNYPVQFDKNWGPAATNWATAVTNGMLQTSGVNAASFIKSATANPASTGFLRLARADTLSWRNQANSADLALAVNSSNQLTFNGTPIGATVSLTDSHIFVGNASNQPSDVAMSGDTTISNLGVVTIADSAITNAKVSSSAAIALSKLAPTTAYYWYAANASGVLTPLAVTASKIVVSDANGLPSTISSPTLTEIAYVGGVTSAIQTQINTKLNKAGDTMTGNLNMGSNKIVSLAAGSNTGEALSYGQALNGSSLTLNDGSGSAPSLNFSSASNTGAYNVIFPTVSAAAANWNTSTHRVTITNHGLWFNAQVALSTTGTLPSGLNNSTTYYVERIDANTIALGRDYADTSSNNPIAFTTQGTGTHTLHPVQTYPLGLSTNGTAEGFVTPTGLILGGMPKCPVQYEIEVLHAETYTDGSNQSLNTADITVSNSGTGAARFIATSGGLPSVSGSTPPSPNVQSYLIAMGASRLGNWWSTGPAVANTAVVAMTGATDTVLLLESCGTTFHFFNDNSSAVWTFQRGSTGTVDFQVGPAAIECNVQMYPKSVTTTQKNALSITEGAVVYDNTLHKLSYYNGTTWVNL